MDKRKIKGACLLRTFDMLRDMSPEEAKTFSLLYKYVMQSGNIYIILTLPDSSVKNAGISSKAKDYRGWST